MSKAFHLMRKNIYIGLSIALLLGCTTTHAQRTGDSARISVGIVERAEQVPLKSDVNRNALIGGAVGWALARNRSSGTQAAAALGGAALGGAGTSRVEGDNMAMQYTVRTTGGSLIQVVTDQREIRIGDCVLVEETGSPRQCATQGSSAVPSGQQTGHVPRRGRTAAGCRRMQQGQAAPVRCENA